MLGQFYPNLRVYPNFRVGLGLRYCGGSGFLRIHSSII